MLTEMDEEDMLSEVNIVYPDWSRSMTGAWLWSATNATAQMPETMAATVMNRQQCWLFQLNLVDLNTNQNKTFLMNMSFNPI